VGGRHSPYIHEKNGKKRDRTSSEKKAAWEERERRKEGRKNEQTEKGSKALTEIWGGRRNLKILREPRTDNGKEEGEGPEKEGKEISKNQKKRGRKKESCNWTA